MLKSRLFFCIFFLLVFLCIGSEVKAGGKVITLVENFTIPANTSEMSFPSLAVGNFKYASILAIANLPVRVSLRYASEPSLCLDQIPKQVAQSWHVSTTGAVLQSNQPGDPFRIRGPYLLTCASNIDNPGSPATITIKIHLSK